MQIAKVLALAVVVARAHSSTIGAPIRIRECDSPAVKAQKQMGQFLHGYMDMEEQIMWIREGRQKGEGAYPLYEHINGALHWWQIKGLPKEKRDNIFVILPTYTHTPWVKDSEPTSEGAFFMFELEAVDADTVAATSYTHSVLGLEKEGFRADNKKLRLDYSKMVGTSSPYFTRVHYKRVVKYTPDEPDCWFAAHDSGVHDVPNRGAIRITFNEIVCDTGIWAHIRFSFNGSPIAPGGEPVQYITRHKEYARRGSIRIYRRDSDAVKAQKELAISLVGMFTNREQKQWEQQTLVTLTPRETHSYLEIEASHVRFVANLPADKANSIFLRVDEQTTADPRSASSPKTTESYVLEVVSFDAESVLVNKYTGASAHGIGAVVDFASLIAVPQETGAAFTRVPYGEQDCFISTHKSTGPQRTLSTNTLVCPSVIHMLDEDRVDGHLLEDLTFPYNLVRRTPRMRV